MVDLNCRGPHRCGRHTAAIADRLRLHSKTDGSPILTAWGPTGDLANVTANMLLFRLLLAVVVLAPLPLASNRPWAWSLLAVVTGVLCGSWAVLVPLGAARAPMPFRRLWAVAVPFLMVLAWAFLQTSGLLPPSLWHSLWQGAGPVLEGASGGALSGMVSADPALTRAAILRMATYGAIFWLAVQLGRERVRAREGLVTVAVAGTVYALYGLIVYFSGNHTILWLEKWAYTDDLTATFVNRNAYGAYAAIGMMCCLALFMHALQPRRHGSRDGGPRAYELAETVLVRALPYLLAVVMLGTAMLLSHSRGALLSTGVAFGILMVMLTLGRIIRLRMALVLGLLVLGIGLVMLSVSGDVTVQRLAEQTDEERTSAYALILRAIGDTPLTGTGLGAFEPTFHLYRDTSLSRPVVWDYAHNVPLELVLDLGIPAAVLYYLSLAVVAGVCIRGVVRRRRDQIYPAVALSVAALLAAHGMVDFSAQIPAVAATLALLLGLGYAQSWSTVEHHDSDERHS